MSTYLPVLDTGKIRIVAIAAPKRVGGRFAGVPGDDEVIPLPEERKPRVDYP